MLVGPVMEIPTVEAPDPGLGEQLRQALALQTFRNSLRSEAALPGAGPSTTSRVSEFSEGMADRARRSTAVPQEQAMARHGRLRNLK